MTEIDLHDVAGKPLGLRVTLPYEAPELLVVWNGWANAEHELGETRERRYFIRRGPFYCEIVPIHVCQPPCVVDRVEP